MLADGAADARRPRRGLPDTAGDDRHPLHPDRAGEQRRHRQARPHPRDTKAVQPGVIVKDPQDRQAHRRPAVHAVSRRRGWRPWAPIPGTGAQDLPGGRSAAGRSRATRRSRATSCSLQEIANLRAAFDQGVLSVDVIGMPSVSDAASGKDRRRMPTGPGAPTAMATAA